ncbi:YdcF family protein [Magnetospirillum sp. UT-4]|uniref:YdcF family protein n=1 Tax=Magnetospirillum sp. UT-4 TaxID=2681467 RepID=UPI001385B45C|nr:YdcF family protein [Magnetospirillum sp. UT-4]CAA7613863.1 conserved hypothetical protein [Magnetospirillum sp. UT-4]
MPPPPVEFDIAIVLGAKVLPDGSPSPALRRRVRHAVGLVRAGIVAELLMSGGPVRHPVPEAEIMRTLALAEGVAPERVHVETGSVNTRGNARLSAAIVAARGWRRVVVVTDAYHLPRALFLFRRHGLAAAGSAARPERPGYEWWCAHLREVFAMLKTLWREVAAR